MSSLTARISRTAALSAAGCFFALCSSGCRVRDVRTATIRLDGLTDDAALQKAEAALRALPDSRLRSGRGETEMSLKILSSDFAAGTLTVRYDSMKVGIKNLQWALAEAGFPNDAFDPATVAAAREH